jgi:predicted permease
VVLAVLFGVVLPVLLLAILGYIWCQKKMRDQYRPLR